MTPLLRQAASPLACPHRWNRGCRSASVTRHPLPCPGGPGGPGGAGLRCPVRGAPGPPRRPPLMRVSGSSIVASLCLPRFSRSAQNLPWKPEPAAAPGNPQAQLGNANRNANPCLAFQGSGGCPRWTDVPRPLMCPRPLGSPSVGMGKVSEQGQTAERAGGSCFWGASGPFPVSPCSWWQDRAISTLSGDS